MKKLLSLVLTFALMLSVMTMLGITASAEESTEVTPIVIPEFEFPTRPYETTAELNIPASEIAAMIPKNIEMKYENGKLMVNDIGAASAEYFGSTSWYTMDLVNGWWVCEISEEEYENSNQLVDFYGENDSWNMLYINGTANLWFTIYFNQNIYINVNIFSLSIEAVYTDGDFRYNDLYIGDYLDCHNVEAYYMDKAVTAEYNYDGSLKEFRAYVDEWYYYVPNFGWTIGEIMVDAPEIFDGMTEEELMAIAPYGDFGNLDELGVDPIVIPEFEFPQKPYATMAELNIPAVEIADMFPENIEIKYEDGKVMVKDIGAARVKSNNPHSYKIRLVDGWWVCEVPESEYSDFIKYLYFYGENDSWEISYVNGRASIWVSIYEGDSIVNVDIDSIRISVYYSIGDFEYNDFYRNGSLEYHTVDAYYMDEIVAVEYDLDGNARIFKTCLDKWYYNIPGIGWSASKDGLTPIDAPEIFADMTFEALISLAPYGDFGNLDEPIVFPEIEIPETVHPTLSDAGINVEEIFNNAPAILERTYENGILKIKNPGFPEFYRISSIIGSNWYYPANEGEYYTLEISEEDYEKDIDIVISIDFKQYYYINFELTFIQFESYDVESEELYFKVVHLRADENHEIEYDLLNGLYVSLCYEGDNLVSQVINITETEYGTITTYNTDGTLNNIEYYNFTNGEAKFYFAGQGWSSHLAQYIPTDTPEMFKDLTEGQLMAYAPSWGLCEHQWVDADCKMAKHCEKCGIWDGEALGHNWVDADCDTPKTCSVCSDTEGESLGHSWKDATEESPKTCESCGETDGEPLPKPEPKPEPTPDIDAEEPNWFIRLINAIIDFFKKLFRLEK